eukprot:6619332-Alexandrium_andersonii.AAC.1
MRRRRHMWQCSSAGDGGDNVGAMVMAMAKAMVSAMAMAMAMVNAKVMAMATVSEMANEREMATTVATMRGARAANRHACCYWWG